MIERTTIVVAVSGEQGDALAEELVKRGYFVLHFDSREIILAALAMVQADLLIADASLDARTVGAAQAAMQRIIVDGELRVASLADTVDDAMAHRRAQRAAAYR